MSEQKVVKAKWLFDMVSDKPIEDGAVIFQSGVITSSGNYEKIKNKIQPDAEIYDFRYLVPATMILGPAVIERDTTTIWIPPGNSAQMDKYGNIVIGMEAHE